jgi:holo-[acyl-carrier protein] synthase
MILGVGTDLLSLERMRRAVEDPSVDSPFLVRTFTLREREEARLRPDPVLCFATRFAGKEAVFKALGLAGDHIRLDEIEILNDAIGRPRVTLHGDLKRHAGEATVELSLSSDTAYCLAFAVLQTAESTQGG